MDALEARKEGAIAESANATANAKEAELKAFDAMQEKMVAAIEKALTYKGNDRPALVARIPVICNDIRWIKRGIFAIFALIGSLLVALILMRLTK